MAFCVPRLCGYDAGHCRRLCAACARVEPDGIICLHTTGTLEGAGIGPLPDQRFSDLLGEAWKTERILLDLTATEFVDSSVIGWLLAGYSMFSLKLAERRERKQKRQAQAELDALKAQVPAAE